MSTNDSQDTDNAMQIFISYKRHEIDSKIAQKLYEKFKSWSYKVWMDVRSILPLTNDEIDGWDTEIDKGLRASHVLLALISPESLASENVQREWRWARENKLTIVWIKLRDFDSKMLSHRFVGANWLNYDDKDIITQLDDTLDFISLTRKDDSAKSTSSSPIPDSDIQEDSSPSQKKSTNEDTLAKIVQLKTLFNDKLNGKMVFGRGFDRDDGKILLARIVQRWLIDIFKPALDEVNEIRSVARDNQSPVSMSSEIQPSLSVQYKKTSKNVNISYPPEGVDILKLYDELGAFVILGAEGAGKSILLFQLATLLLYRNHQQPSEKIPLILNLSSWGRDEYDKVSLESWIALEAQQVYKMYHEKFTIGLSANRFILLLDGLDEISPKKLADRISKINKYLKNKPNPFIVICRRINDDDEQMNTDRNQQHPLNFSHAIYMKGVQEEQIKAYLEKVPHSYFGELYHSEDYVKELTKTPLFFVMLAKAYFNPKPDAHRRQIDEPRERIKDIVNHYIEFKSDEAEKLPYDTGKLDKILIWLTKRSLTNGVILQLNRMTAAWFERRPYGNWHDGCLFTLIWIIPILLWAGLGLTLGGVLGASVLAGSTAVFSWLIWKNFFKDQYYYYNPKWENIASKFNKISRYTPLKKGVYSNIPVLIGIIFLGIGILFGIPHLIFEHLSTSMITLAGLFGVGTITGVGVGYFISPKDKLSWRNIAGIAAILSIWWVLMLYLFDQVFTQSVWLKAGMSSFSMIVMTLSILIITPEGETSASFIAKAFRLLIGTFVVGSMLTILLPQTWLLVLPSLLIISVLLVGGARILQLWLFTVFFRMMFQLPYRPVMDYLVKQNVLRHFADGYTYRHESFQQHWKDDNHEKTIQEKFNDLFDQLLDTNELNIRKVNLEDVTPIIDKIVELGHEVVPLLIKKMNESKDEIRKFIVVALANDKLIRIAVPKLIENWKLIENLKWEKKRDVIHYTLVVFSKAKNPDLINYLSQYSDHSDKLIRLTAIEALGNIGNQKSTIILRSRLSEEQDDDVKRKITDLLPK